MQLLARLMRLEERGSVLLRAEPIGSSPSPFKESKWGLGVLIAALVGAGLGFHYLSTRSRALAEREDPPAPKLTADEENSIASLRSEFAASFAGVTSPTVKQVRAAVNTFRLKAQAAVGPVKAAAEVDKVLEVLIPDLTREVAIEVAISEWQSYLEGAAQRSATTMTRTGTVSLAVMKEMRGEVLQTGVSRALMDYDELRQKFSVSSVKKLLANEIDKAGAEMHEDLKKRGATGGARGNTGIKSPRQLAEERGALAGGASVPEFEEVEAIDPVTGERYMMAKFLKLEEIDPVTGERRVDKRAGVPVYAGYYDPGPVTRYVPPGQDLELRAFVGPLASPDEAAPPLRTAEELAQMPSWAIQQEFDRARAAGQTDAVTMEAVSGFRTAEVSSKAAKGKPQTQKVAYWTRKYVYKLGDKELEGYTREITLGRIPLIEGMTSSELVQTALTRRVKDGTYPFKENEEESVAAAESDFSSKIAEGFQKLESEQLTGISYAVLEALPLENPEIVKRLRQGDFGGLKMLDDEVSKLALKIQAKTGTHAKDANKRARDQIGGAVRVFTTKIHDAAVLRQSESMLERAISLIDRAKRDGRQLTPDESAKLKELNEALDREPEIRQKAQKQLAERQAIAFIEQNRDDEEVNKDIEYVKKKLVQIHMIDSRAILNDSIDARDAQRRQKLLKEVEESSAGVREVAIKEFAVEAERDLSEMDRAEFNERLRAWETSYTTPIQAVSREDRKKIQLSQDLYREMEEAKRKVEQAPVPAWIEGGVGDLNDDAIQRQLQALNALNTDDFGDALPANKQLRYIPGVITPRDLYAVKRQSEGKLEEMISRGPPVEPLEKTNWNLEVKRLRDAARGVDKVLGGVDPGPVQGRAFWPPSERAVEGAPRDLLEGREGVVAVIRSQQVGRVPSLAEAIREKRKGGHVGVNTYDDFKHAFMTPDGDLEIAREKYAEYQQRMREFAAMYDVARLTLEYEDKKHARDQVEAETAALPDEAFYTPHRLVPTPKTEEARARFLEFAQTKGSRSVDDVVRRASWAVSDAPPVAPEQVRAVLAPVEAKSTAKDAAHAVLKHLNSLANAREKNRELTRVVDARIAAIERFKKAKGREPSKGLISEGRDQTYRKKSGMGRPLTPTAVGGRRIEEHYWTELYDAQAQLDLAEQAVALEQFELETMLSPPPRARELVSTRQKIEQAFHAGKLTREERNWEVKKLLQGEELPLYKSVQQAWIDKARAAKNIEGAERAILDVLKKTPEAIRNIQQISSQSSGDVLRQEKTEELRVDAAEMSRDATQKATNYALLKQSGTLASARRALSKMAREEGRAINVSEWGPSELLRLSKAYDENRLEEFLSAKTPPKVVERAPEVQVVQAVVERAPEEATRAEVRRARHKKFGEGTVVETVDGPEPKVVIEFPNWGRKTILLRSIDLI